MAIEFRVPMLGESIKEATVARWLKQPGEAVKADEPLVELETEKVAVEVPAPAAGVLADTRVKVGDTVGVGQVLGSIGDGAASVASASPKASPSAPTAGNGASQGPAMAAPAPKPSQSPPPSQASRGPLMPPAPSARKLMVEKGLSQDQVAGSGVRGQILKGDVIAAETGAGVSAPPALSVSKPADGEAARASIAARPALSAEDSAREERVHMSRLRQTIARRLKDAQNTAAMLTTFNDVDMGAVMDLRSQYKDLFEKKHGVKLGFMGFFVKACVQALKEVPAMNAEIDGQDIVYKNYYHIGIAVSTERGLIVPVLRNADALGLAQVEAAIADSAKRGREGKLTITDMQGGTFSITNGGVFGSLLSTPILNAPQSGILGMHRIEKRPVVQDDQIVIRPMMYLAVSYDHRLVDGREAVTFLVRVKEGLEDPKRLILEL
jgi:2-oxoglutarate dehydrogenase E2 component (dihydrolipoamide succinyltransferase)